MNDASTFFSTFALPPREQRSPEDEASYAAEVMANAWVLHVGAMENNPLLYLDNFMEFAVNLWAPTKNDLERTLCGMLPSVAPQTIRGMLDMKYGETSDRELQ